MTSVFTKTMRVMQWTAIFLLGFCLHVAASGHSQEVTMKASHLPLKQVLQQVRQQTGVLFIYDEEQIPLGSPVSIDARQMPLREFLTTILQEKKINFEINKNTVVLEVSVAAPKLSLQVDQAPITGVIRSADGSVLSGASIHIKGKNTGTVSDENGRFTINANKGDILIVSFTGYQLREYRVGEDTEVNISLLLAETKLEEVIIGTNYNSTTKELSVMNISKITAKDIENKPITNPLLALQGLVPGIDVTPNSGGPAGALKINIRGINSLRSGGAYPLYVIDGVPIDSRPVESGSSSVFQFGFDPLATIDPMNIESIEVLKDAAATAIYGSRGANGVIKVTTKRRNKFQKPTIEVNAYTGSGEITNSLSLLNTKEYIAMRKEAYMNDGVTPAGFSARDLLVWDTSRYTDWQKVLLGGTSNISDVRLNVSDGDIRNSFLVGVAYHNESTVLSNDFGYKTLSGHFALTHTSSDEKFKSSITGNYGLTKNETFDDPNFINFALSLPPNAPALYKENLLNWEPDPNGVSTWVNPLSYLRKTQSVNTNNIVINGVLSYEIFQGLTGKINIGFTEYNSNEKIKQPISALDPASISSFSRAQAIYTNNNRRSYIIEPQLNYERNWQEHHLNFVAGYSWQKSNTAYSSILGTGYTTDALLNSIDAATNVDLTQEDAEYKYVSGLININYDFQRKILFQLSARRDGSSRFGPANEYGNFGAIAGAYIFSKESFFSNNLKFLSLGKVRGSFGTTGNDQIGDYQYYNFYSATDYPFSGFTAVHPQSLFNPNYEWEKTKKIEAALELGVLNNRITAEIAWYKHSSSNQLINLQLPTITGFQTILANFDAKIENTGSEILVNSDNIVGKRFRWSTTFNLTFPRNKLAKYDNIEQSAYASRYKVGAPLSIQNIYLFKGVSKETGKLEVTDKNSDGIIDSQDRYFQAAIDKKYYGGLLNTLKFDQFELMFLIQFVSNPNSRPLNSFSLPGRFGNQPHDVVNRWQMPDDDTFIGKFSQLSTNNNFYINYVRFSDYSIINSSFIRLKSLMLAYTLDNNISKKIFMKSLKVFVQGQNLFTWSKSDSKLFDPETGNFLPPLRIISAGLNVRF